MNKNSNITADKILGLLADRHSKDVFVPECKDGPTWYGNHFRLDAWVMPRSWTKLKYIGYEIKISRSDFIKDQKHIEYLNLCHEFYFVCPQGIIKEDELSDGIGLLIVSANGTKLYTKKKAKHRKIDEPVSLLQYIIMCRSKIQSNDYYNYRDHNLEYWKARLADEDVTKVIGHTLSKKIKNDIEKRVEAVQSENEELSKKIKHYEEFKKLLNEMGITDKDSYYTALSKINELKKDAKSFFDIYALKNLKSSIDAILQKIE